MASAAAPAVADNPKAVQTYKVTKFSQYLQKGDKLRGVRGLQCACATKCRFYNVRGLQRAGSQKNYKHDKIFVADFAEKA